MRRVIITVTLLLLCPWWAQAQIPRALDVEAQEPAVVVMAAGDFSLRFPNLKVQQDIAKGALEAAHVVFLIDEYQDLASLKLRFTGDPNLKKALDNGRLTFSVVPHLTNWIRDYGPQLVSTKDHDLILVDSIYKDVRVEFNTNRDRRDVAAQRFALAKELNLNLIQKKNTNNAELKERLHVLQQLDDILEKDKHNDRTNDDYSPYETMQVVTGRAAIKVERPNFYLDGGNLLRLGDGRLLTTKDLFLANRAKENELPQALKDHFRVNEVVYLESLPGPVIKHVDMFLLPAVGNRVLLASYEAAGASLVNPYIEAAAQAMKKNKETLTKLGYEVIDVPSLPPEFENLRVYYPTNLNVLTLRNKDGGFLILAPYYPEFDPYLQFNAYKKMRKAFGDNAKVVPIDCSVTASQHGAVHCLTATVPHRLSRFALPVTQAALKKAAN